MFGVLVDDPISTCQEIRIIRDRKSTRLNSSHDQISYAVFCLKKKKTRDHSPRPSRHTRQTGESGPDMPQPPRPLGPHATRSPPRSRALTPTPWSADEAILL